MPAKATKTPTVCVDIGNSGLRCVLVLEYPSNERLPWTGEVLRVDWPENRDNDAIDRILKSSLQTWLPTAHGHFHWLVSSVQRTMESRLHACVLELGAASYRRVEYRDLKVQVQVDYPERVGIDRLLAALAASTTLAPSTIRADQRLIVIQAGSAITVDLLEPPNIFAGGAIMPGVPMMLRLLSKAADLLPEVAAKELLKLPPLPGKNTTEAMNAGVSSAVVGGVQHLVARYREQLGNSTPIVLSGGDGPLLSPHLNAPVHVVDHLVLRGLASLVTFPADQQFTKAT